MKRQNVQRFIALLSFMFLLTVSGYANEEGGKGFHKKEMKEKWGQKREEIHKKLGLTPEQESKLKANREEHHSEMEKLHEQIKAKKEELKQALDQPTVDEAKVRALHNEMKELKSQMEDGRFNGILEVRKILTPEQFEKFKKLKEEHKGKEDHEMKDKDNPPDDIEK